MARKVYLRTSERKTFKRCPQRWWWAWREGLVSNRPPSNPLWFGIGVHNALAEYYIPGTKRGPHPAETWEKWAAGEVRFFREQYGDRYEEAEYVDMRTLGTKMLEGYVEHHQGDPQWEVIAPEYSAEVSIRRVYYPGRFVTYGFTLDCIVRDLADGRLKAVETKTAAIVSTSHLSLEPQVKSYLALGTPGLRAKGLLGPDDNVEEVIYNFLRKATPSDRPRNAAGLYLNQPSKAQYVAALTGVDRWTAPELKKMTVAELESIAVANFIKVEGEVSKVQPPPLFVRHPERITRGQLQNQIRAIQDEVYVMDAIRAGQIPLWKNQVDSGPTACTGCPFFNMCELHDMGHDWEEYRDMAFHVEDPYAAHRNRKSA
jgi:hypothetical protein